jgi:hypothetical protein
MAALNGAMDTGRNVANGTLRPVSDHGSLYRYLAMNLHAIEAIIH